nr:PREDICTED: MHC class I polypeptide-related sequence A-like [Equus przewalskii]
MGMTIRIPQGEEQSFTCHVEHSGNHTARPVPSGKAPVQQSGWPTILLVAAVVGIVSAIIPCALWYKKKRRTTLPAEIPESTVPSRTSTGTISSCKEIRAGGKAADQQGHELPPLCK